MQLASVCKPQNGAACGAAASVRRPHVAAPLAATTARPDLQPAGQLQPASRRATLALLAGAAGSLVLANPAAPALAAGGRKPGGDGGDWSSPGLSAPVDPSQPKFFKTDSGVRVQVLAEGSGPAASTGDTVLVDYVLRRSNGYFIYGTVDGVSFQPKDVPVGPVVLRLGEGSVLPGLEDVLLGQSLAASSGLWCRLSWATKLHPALCRRCPPLPLSASWRITRARR